MEKLKTREEIEEEIQRCKDEIAFYQLVMPNGSRMGSLAYTKRIDDLITRIKELEKELELKVD